MVAFIDHLCEFDFHNQLGAAAAGIDGASDFDLRGNWRRGWIALVEFLWIHQVGECLGDIDLHGHHFFFYRFVGAPDCEPDI